MLSQLKKKLGNQTNTTSHLILANNTNSEITEKCKILRKESHKDKYHTFQYTENT